MTINKSSVFLELIEELSKSTYLNEGDELSMAREILFKSTHFLKINRANAWLMNDQGNALFNLLAYDKKKDLFYNEGELKADDFPVYFNHITRSDIIISFEARNEPFNQELVEPYLIPNNVFSMMEVPILSGGRMKGIVCFEATDEIRNWSPDEQHFALALCQLLTITIETKEKNRYRDELEKSISEKSELLAQINHRVTNNLAVFTALIRSESHKAKDAYHEELFENLTSKALSLSTLQNSINQSTNHNYVNFGSYLSTLIKNIDDTFGQNKSVKLDLHLENVNIEMAKSVPFSLIVNELLTNCFKKSFQENSSNTLFVEISQDEIKTNMTIKYSGSGFPKNSQEEWDGYDLVTGLIDQLDGTIDFEVTPNETSIEIEF